LNILPPFISFQEGCPQLFEKRLDAGFFLGFLAMGICQHFCSPLMRSDFYFSFLPQLPFSTPGDHPFLPFLLTTANSVQFSFFLLPFLCFATIPPVFFPLLTHIFLPSCATPSGSQAHGSRLFPRPGPQSLKIVRYITPSLLRVTCPSYPKGVVSLSPPLLTVTRVNFLCAWSSLSSVFFKTRTPTGWFIPSPVASVNFNPLPRGRLVYRGLHDVLFPLFPGDLPPPFFQFQIRLPPPPMVRFLPPHLFGSLQ